jgi:hypothetical protein
MLQYAKADPHIDTNRIYVTGLSMGGAGAWGAISFDTADAKNFAAAAPIASTRPYPETYCNISLLNIPVWVFHNDGDAGQTSPYQDKFIIDAINQCVSPAVYTNLRKTFYHANGHGGWDWAYDTGHVARPLSTDLDFAGSVNQDSVNLYEWFLQHSRQGSTGPSPSTYYGMDSVVLWGRPALVKRPTEDPAYTPTKTYPLIIEIPDQDEYADSSKVSGVAPLFNSGTPKLLKNGINIYPNDAAGHPIYYIAVKYQPTQFGDLTFPESFNRMWDTIMARYPVDTTKDIHGQYKYIMLAGVGKGGSTIFNFTNWTAAMGYGGDVSYRSLNLKKIVTSRMHAVTNDDAQLKTPGIIARFNYKKLRFFEHNQYPPDGNEYAADDMYNRIGQYSNASEMIFSMPALTLSQVTDSMYSPFGADATTNIYRLLVEDTVEATPVIAVKPKIIHDLINYSGPQADKNKVWNFFDGFGNTDPKNGVITFTNGADTTQAIPQKMYASYYPAGRSGDLYYPGNRGARLVFDMTGARDMTDTAHKILLTDVYGFEYSYDAGDTLYFYNLDTIFTQPVNERWKFLARPDSLLTPFATLVTQGAYRGAWSNVTANERVRYVLVRWLPKNRGTYFTLPYFTELSLYGAYLYDTTTLNKRPDSYTGPLPSKTTSAQTYGAFTGTNLGQGVDTLQLGYDGNIRIYGSTSYWDADSSNATTASATYTFDKFPDIGPLQYAAFKRANKRFWWSIRGTNNYTYKTLHDTTGVNIDDWNSDPENPFNYSRDGNFYYNYAAKFGRVNVPTGNTKWTGDGNYNNGQNGLDLIEYVENGNEEDAHGVSQLAYWARSVSDYDGYEGRVGIAGRTGLKKADPDFKLVMSGTMELDTNLVDNLIWFSKIMRTDGKLPFDVINFHHYPRTFDTLGYAPGYEEMVGAHGESPEADDIYKFYTGGTKAIYNYLGGDTSVKIFNTEYGYGNWATPASTPNEVAYPWDIGCTPPNSGYDSLQLKGMLMARSELIMAFTPVAAYNEFFFHNTNFDTANSYMLFASYGRAAGRNISTFQCTKFFPWWYYRAGLYNSLKDYYPDALLNNGGTGLWITKWRHAVYSDSVCYIVWKGSYNGSVLSGQSIPVGFPQNNQVNQVDLSFMQTAGTVTPITASGGSISVDVYERPLLYFLKEGTAARIAQITAPGHFRVYPNPVPGNSVIIEAANEKTGRVLVRMIDLQGRLIKEQSFNNNGGFFRQQFYTGPLATGSYVLTVQFAGQLKAYYFKLIKQ